MVVTFEDRDGGTEVAILFEQTPAGIRPEDNDAGARLSLEKLAHMSSRKRKFKLAPKPEIESDPLPSRQVCQSELFQRTIGALRDLLQVG